VFWVGLVVAAQLALPRSFTLHIVEHLDSVDADVDAKYAETLKSSNPTVLVLSYSDFKVVAGGQDIPAPAPSTRELHLDDQGRWKPSELSEWTSISRLTPDLFASWIRGVPLNKDSDAAITVSDSADPKAKVSGTARLRDSANGFDVIECKFSATTGAFDSPLQITMKMFVDPKSGEMDHAEGDVTSMPPQVAGRYNVQSAHFELKRT